MRIENSTGFRPTIRANNIVACKESATHLHTEFGARGVYRCEEITHPRKGELINIPDDRETADENPDCRIIPAGKYRVLDALGSTSSHWIVLENLETGTREVATIAYHEEAQVDWRECKKIQNGPLFMSIEKA